MVDDSPMQDRHDQAAELALGLLEGEERAEALRLFLSDPDFTAEVEAWGNRLSPLFDMIKPEAPSGDVWTAIETRTSKGPPTALIRSLRLWRGGAVLAGTLAACLALVLILRPSAWTAPASLGISQLADAQNATSMAISYDPRSGLLRLGPNQLANKAKSPELWIIPEDGLPRSLGIIAADGGELPVQTSLRRFLREGVTLAITLEDPTTAPHKAPTSLPILTGKISII